MSGSSAIAAVTAALRVLVGEAARRAPGLGHARVTTLRPGATPDAKDAPRVNVYLLRVLENAAMRNLDLPTWDSAGELRKRPVAAVDLQVLITFHGDETRLEPQRLLGVTLATLHARPILRPEFFARLAEAASAPGDAYGFLADAKMDEAPDAVRISLIDLDLEEFSKLWSSLLQAPHALGLFLQAGPVFLDGPGSPREVTPVKTRHVAVGLMPPPEESP